MRAAIASLLISVSIALLPLFNKVSAVDLGRTSKDNLLVIIFGIASIIFTDKKRNFPMSGWLVLVVAFFFIVLNQHNSASINVMFYTFYATSSLLFFVKFYEYYENKYKEWFLNGMSIGLIIQVIFIIFSHFGISLELYIQSLIHSNIAVNGSLSQPIGKSIGTLANQNLTAGYLSLCALSFLRPKWIYFLPIAIAAVFSTGSLMGVITVIAGILYFLHINIVPKKVAYGLAVFSMFLACIVGMNGADSGRLEIWGKVLNIMQSSNYLFGNGPGWFADQGMNALGSIVIQEHNVFLTIFTTFGIMGILVLLYFLNLYTKIKDNDRVFSSMVFALFINGFGHFSLHQSTMVIIIIVAIIISATGEQDGSNLVGPSSSK